MYMYVHINIFINFKKKLFACVISGGTWLRKLHFLLSLYKVFTVLDAYLGVGVANTGHWPRSLARAGSLVYAQGPIPHPLLPTPTLTPSTMATNACQDFL